MANRTADTKSTLSQERIIGKVTGAVDGPVFIFIGGMHGNEPSSIQALKKVFTELRKMGSLYQGTVMGIAGNLPALEECKRFIDEDLNRIWIPHIIERVRAQPEEMLPTSEQRELKRILQCIDPYLNEADEKDVYFIDLHSFSAHNGMFAITAPAERTKNVASFLNVPLIYGIEEELEGAAIRYVLDKNAIGLAFEAGQHVDEKTVYNQEAAIWMLLEAAGLIERGEFKSFNKYETYFIKEAAKLPENVQLVYRHIIQPEDQFEMKPGYENFQVIKKGEILAYDHSGPIYAKCDGYILMPLYQNQGTDGFFIVQEC